MKHWNGWGDEATNYPLPDSATGYQASLVGLGEHLKDVSLGQALATVKASRLPGIFKPAPHSLISTDPEERLGHARGQSLPDWAALCTWRRRRTRLECRHWKLSSSNLIRMG